MIENQLLCVAVLGAHSNFKFRGFRQTDLRFMAELFTNWIDVFLKPELPKWHNTQALRYLDRLVEKGYAQSSGKGKARKYKLTRIGLLEMVHELVEIDGYADIKHTLLTYYFIRAYAPRIMVLIDDQGSGFSKAVKLEIEHLFDHKRFLKLQVEELKRQIKRLQMRVDETRSAANLGDKLKKQGETVDTIIDKVAASFPYELENQKPMNELFKEIEPDQRLWEITEGNRHRAETLWQTQLNLLENYLETLRRFK